MQTRSLPQSKATGDTTAEFELVLATAAKVSINSANKVASRSSVLASQLLSQAVVTATTIRALLRPEKRANVPGIDGDVEIVDLPSTAILSRAIVELYLVHYYLAVDKVSSEERDFRLLWWDWHEINERLWSLERIGSQNPMISSMRRSRTKLRSIISGHRNYGKLPQNLKKEFEKNPPLPTLYC